MTIQEAIKIFDFNRTEESGAAYKVACDIAIRSLEAWEKVKLEIENLPTKWAISDEYKEGLQDCLEIINKRLSEVEDSENGRTKI